MDDIILRVESPGLGDHIIYSTIPERFAVRGHRVLISNRTPVRNSEVRSLLYDENPFVSGWSDKPANAGNSRAERGVPHNIRFRSIIEAIEFAHGLPADGLYPKIYYVPRLVDRFAAAVIVDPRTHSQPFPPEVFDRLLERLDFPRTQTYVVQSPHSGSNGARSAASYPRVRVGSLHEYIDLIYSCAAYVGTESGGSALASAVRQERTKPEIYAITTTKNWNDRAYIFPNVTYTVVSGLQPDW
jgi:hypothetical protein